MDDNISKLPDLPTIEEIADEQDKMAFLASDRWSSVDIGPYMLDFTRGYEAPRYTLSWDGIPFAPLGGIHAITGQAGNGKTMTLAQFMAAILCGEYGNLKREVKLTKQDPITGEEIDFRPTVLYIDTEMEEANTIAVKNRVMSMCGRDIKTKYDDFHVLMLREVPESVEKNDKGNDVKVPASVMRWRMVLKAICQFLPTVAFIDGLLDVVADFNDNKECAETIYKCMQVASHYDMSVWCIVHQNPGGEKLVGHLGSFLERKVTDIIQTRKVKDDNTNDVTFEVKQKKARGRDIKDWKFRVLPVNGWGMPEQLDIDLVGKKAKHTAEEVKMWLDANRSAVDWPATLTDIRNKIFKAKCGITNNDELQAYATIATNRRFIIPQPFAEWDEGQKKPKYYINEVEYSNDPPF